MSCFLRPVSEKNGQAEAVPRGDFWEGKVDYLINRIITSSISWVDVLPRAKNGI